MRLRDRSKGSSDLEAQHCDGCLKPTANCMPQGPAQRVQDTQWASLHPMAVSECQRGFECHKEQIKALIHRKISQGKVECLLSASHRSGFVPVMDIQSQMRPQPLASGMQHPNSTGLGAAGPRGAGPAAHSFPSQQSTSSATKLIKCYGEFVEEKPKNPKEGWQN